MSPFSREQFQLGPGALGTMLQVAGLPLGTAPERWNLESADAVARVHAAYAEAGAAWLVTNTFGGNRTRLEASGLAPSLAEVNRQAVELARQSASLPILASLGPTGAASAQEWERVYVEQVEYLMAAGVDGFLVETVVRCEEGLAAVRAASASGSGPVIASFTPGGDGRLLDGTPAELVAAAWREAGAAVVGVNCGTGPESLLEPARRLAAAGLGPVYAAPSAGLPRMEDGVPHYDLTPDAYAQAAVQFRESGVTLFAGCCGITPEHLRQAVLRLRETDARMK